MKQGPLEAFANCANNLETKCLSDKLSRHGSLESLESLEKSKNEKKVITSVKPRRKEIEVADHIQFLITEKSASHKNSRDIIGDLLDEADMINKSKQFFFLFNLI